MKGKTIRLGRTAWGTLRALAQNNGRGFVSWGRRYAELSPGRAVIFSQVYHMLVSQQLVTAKGQNAPGMMVLTDRGIIAYRTGKIEAIVRAGPFLDDAVAEPFVDTGDGIPKPGSHRWAEEAIRAEQYAKRMREIGSNKSGRF